MSLAYFRFCSRARVWSYAVMVLWAALAGLGLYQGALAQGPTGAPEPVRIDVDESIGVGTHMGGAPPAAPEATQPPPAVTDGPGTLKVAGLRKVPATAAQRVVPVLGILLFVAIAFALSSHRRRVNWRTVVVGLAIQGVFGWVVLKTHAGQVFFDGVNGVVLALLGYTEQGTIFLVRSFVDGQWPPALVNFLFKVLPTIVFFSSFMSVLYHLGLMQLVVRFMAFVMARAMGTSGAESMSAAANIFLGQTEAPLVVKPYVARMTHSELMAIMTGGFATVAGGVMAAYVGMLKDYFPDIAGHLMAASIMNAPAGLLLAKLMQPEVEEPETADTSSSGDARRSFAEVLVDLVTLRFLARTWRAIRAEEKPYPNVIGAAAGGAADGMSLVLNVAAMLLAFIALIALLNAGVVWLTGLTGHPLSINEILGAVLGPVAWLMGVPWSEAGTVASLLGEKAVLNEFIAYTHLGELCRNTPHVLSERTVAITTYALLGFANFSSIGIQIGGIGGIAPNRRSDLARLGLRAMIGGTLAAYISACIAAMMLG